MAKDSAKLERSGRVEGNAEWIAARTFGGLQYDGSTFIEAGEVGDFESDQPFTLSLWVKPQKNAQGKDSKGSLIARLEDEKTFRGYDLYFDADERFYFRLTHEAKVNAIKVRTDLGIKWDSWQHVCVTYDGSSSAGGVQIFVDGNPLKLNREQDNLTESIRTKKPLRIGSRPEGFRPSGIFDEIRIFPRVLKPEEVWALILRDNVVSVLASPEIDKTDQNWKTLLRYYLSNEDKEYPLLKKLESELAEEEKELRRPLTTVMVMGDKERTTYILRRGNYDDRTEQKVLPGIPENLPQLAPNAPSNRLGLAQWLFQPENPLTALSLIHI